jgi:hypothetical protein
MAAAAALEFSGPEAIVRPFTTLCLCAPLLLDSYAVVEDVEEPSRSTVPRHREFRLWLAIMHADDVHQFGDRGQNLLYRLVAAY